MIRCKSWLVLLLLSVAVVGCMKARTPRWYIFAEGFEGWVWINYEIENADPLPVNEDAEVLNIPECVVLFYQLADHRRIRSRSLLLSQAGDQPRRD